MDDATDSVEYYVPDYVVITAVLEIAASVAVLLACLVVVRRGAAARVGAAGALLAGAATGLGLACTLAVLRRDAGPWNWPEWVWQLITVARAGGLALVGVAVVLALSGRADAAPAERA